ncbi:hypothetical protein N7492_001045 [Penicillium capsulatum]|uniref:Zn(2)-C6 fungal-type domain-containing protein n=1 Tax=Penicillium capsulatum TaxID=69766 RepID=A0A9W9LZZ5_9EURO|nr:hypothetical protein N7492_001045 [Penicillium capsulatum]KAJ6129896.1 hypothetical protein N7512_002676 [Penicillium capsulatum]
MGGAPWRSNGCNTCRKRKVKCDFQRPQCARCLRGGHRCEGYERDRKFIHTFADPAPGPSDALTVQSQAEDPSFTVINVNSQIRSQLFSLFVDSYVPSLPVGQVNFRCQQGSDLFREFPSIMDGKNSQLFDRAVSALASVFVGRKVGDDGLMRHGVMLYNNAIQIFSRLISKNGLPIQEVLSANVVFQLYEVINSTSGFAGWMAHMQGANAVVARHRKSLERDELSKLLVRQLKLSNIFHAIGKSKSALLFCPMWRALSPTMSSDDPIDEIIDILMECTVLVEKISSSPPESEVQRLELACWSLRHQIQAWYRRLQGSSLGKLYTPNSDLTEVPLSPSAKSTFPHTFHFVALDVAEAHMLCWTALLILSSFFHRIECQREYQPQAVYALSPVSEDAKSDDQRRSEYFLQEAEFYANQICRSVGYFIKPHMNILGGHNLLFPVSMAAKFFYGNHFDDKYQWCQEVFAVLDSIGLGLANVLQGTPWSRYKLGEVGS